MSEFPPESSHQAQPAQDTSPLRLAYELQVLGRGIGFRLVPRRAHGQDELKDNDCRELMPKLHPLDQAIVRELRSGTVFAQLGEASFAKVLSLLAQRDTRLEGQRLRILEEPLVPRVKIEVLTLPGGLPVTRIHRGLGDTEGTWFELSSGRLLAGAQAYFLREGRISPIASPAPWELANWARETSVDLDASTTPMRRDAVVKELTKVGVSPADLAALAVLRTPPRTFIARLAPIPDAPVPSVKLELLADYAGTVAAVLPQRPLSVYLEPAGDTQAGLIERDLVAEELAREQLGQLGFKPDKDVGGYVARGEQALASLDERASPWPVGWAVERVGPGFVFRTDLSLHTSVRLLEDQGMLDLQVGVRTLTDEEAVAALVDMKDLLVWLQTGARYVRLADGSYVAPSSRFRRGLRLLEDLGALQERVLVSPLCVGILRSLGDEAGLDVADAATRAWLEELTSHEAPPPVDPPQALAGELRDYQKRGLDWLAMLHRHRLTGILADDMGLGKTVQALALLAYAREKEGPKPSLVVAPTSVVTVWRDEAARFFPGMSILVWHGPPKERHAADPAKADLVITSYGVVRRDAEKLAKYGFRYVILDEAQSAKNAATQNAKAIRALKSERRLALSGTPLENRPEELWSIFDFLAPGFLGSIRSFRKRYARPLEQGDQEAMTLLKLRLGPLVLRRIKSEVAKELPAKLESVVRCEMHHAQRVLYDHVAGRLRESVQKKIEQVGIERAQIDILAALTRLRQICCDPALLPHPEGAKVPASAKLELFHELMREALASERRIVVFSQFVEMQKRLIHSIERLGVKPLWLHGGTRDRDKVVSAFQAPDGPPVIVVSLRAGGTGITLTRADMVLHYDPWWNPAVEQQATDRTHRLGQTQQVNVYKLVCAQSIEERVVALARDKEALARELLGSEGSTGIKRITKDDVLALLG